ncbi:hypothetical protein BBP40_009224 [Aspergillus hancockii]|nr:hypothetical protein BBP40_009224 [Aspergillus hancockii]
MLVLPLLAWALGPAPLLAQALTNNNSSIHHNAADLEKYKVLQRNAAIQSQLAQSPVRGIKKMSSDEGEKFFLDYWYFEAGNSTDLQSPENSETGHSDIESRSYPYQPSYSLDPDGGPNWMGHFSPLLRRDFKCPAGTNACTSINRPNSCCSTGSTCEIVEDTGSGDVGCCPSGQMCSGTIGSCQKGYTSCPASLGGGCCIPGYECVSGGCANVYTVTITLSSTIMVSTVTTTVPATSTVSSSTSTSSSSSSMTSSTSQSTGEFTPPARPTSLSTATTSRTTGSICPIGFYACSAVYRGGCCRTGRDCDTTSCPETPSTTITSNDRTIVVPVETEAPPATTGRCASGWFSCADTAGGGCCPTGFACGPSCTAVTTATATGTVAKEQPTNSAADRHFRDGMTTMLGITMLGMLWTLE